MAFGLVPILKRLPQTGKVLLRMCVCVCVCVRTKRQYTYALALNLGGTQKYANFN